jgi:hypothetical protein
LLGIIREPLGVDTREKPEDDYRSVLEKSRPHFLVVVGGGTRVANLGMGFLYQKDVKDGVFIYIVRIFLCFNYQPMKENIN